MYLLVQVTRQGNGAMDIAEAKRIGGGYSERDTEAKRKQDVQKGIKARYDGLSTRPESSLFRNRVTPLLAATPLAVELCLSNLFL